MRSLPIGKLAKLVALVVTFATALALLCAPTRAQDRPDHILYFTRSAGYRHEVIPVSREILKQIGEIAPRFEVDATEDVAVFTAQNLRRYGAIMFFTAGELLMNDVQKQALIDFVRDGGGFLGVHSATDTFYKWPEYGKLIGGYFDQHPWHQSVRIDVADRSDPRLRRRWVPRAHSPRPGLGRSEPRERAPASLWLATGLDTRLRQRTRLLHRPWSRGGGVARFAI